MVPNRLTVASILQSPRVAEEDADAFVKTAWRSADTVIALAVLLPWIALTAVDIPLIGILWWGGGMLAFEAAFLLIWSLLAWRQRQGWRAYAIGLYIATPWVCLGLFGPQWLTINSVWWGFYLYQMGLMLGLPIWLLRQRDRQPLLADWSWRSFVTELVWAIPVLLGLFALIYTTTYFWELAGYGSGMQWRTWLNAAHYGGVPAILILMTLSFTLVPVAEEFFFRGLLFNSLRRRFSIVLACALQAFFFASIHPTGFLGLAALGLILGGVYAWRKTILAPIIVHAGHNGIFAVYFLWSLTIMFLTPILGIQGDDSAGQIVVHKVRPQASAALGGIEEQDIIVSYDGHPVTNLDVLHRHVLNTPVGTTVPVVVLRDGEEVTVDVTMHNRFRR